MKHVFIWTDPSLPLVEGNFPGRIFVAKLLVCPGGRGSTSVIWLPTDPMSADNHPMSATQSVQVAPADETKGFFCL